MVRALEVRRGTVDMVLGDLNPDQVAAFGNRGGFKVWRRGGANYAYIGFNCSRPPLDNTKVRQALAYATDRKEFIAYLLRGYARPATSLLCPENPYFNPLTPAYPLDLAKARALLDEAGFPVKEDGLRFRLTFKTSSSQEARMRALTVQDQWRKVGVGLKIVSLEWGTFYRDVVRGDIQAYSLTWVGLSDPDVFRLRFGSNYFPPKGLNRGRYKNKELDALVARGAATSDPIIRRESYNRVQLILARDNPYVSLFHPDVVAVSTGRVKDLTLYPDGSFRGILTAHR